MSETKKEIEERKRRRLTDAIERQTKAAENNLKLIRSAVWDDRFAEAERYRRHANEHFEELGELVKELS